MSVELLYSEPTFLVRGGQLRRPPPRRPRAVVLPVQRGTPLPPETSRFFFHPGRFGARLAPEPFRSRLHEIDPRLEACWHPVMERWQVWCFAPEEVRTPRLRGWKLLFPVQTPEGAYLPLDERTLAKAWDRCGRLYGSGRAYWDRVEREFWRDYERRQRQHQEAIRGSARDYWDWTTIKVSMAGPSLGSKFVRHHTESARSALR